MLIDTPFRFEMDVFFTNPRSDLDNALKVVLDCLQECKVIKNDNKCIEIHTRKFIDKENPRVEFKLNTLDTDERDETKAGGRP